MTSKFSSKIMFSAVTVLTLIMSLPALGAVDCNVSGGKACRGPIKEIIKGVFPTNGGDLLLTSPIATNSLNCQGAGGGQNIILKGNHLRFEETYALVLYALSTDANVTIRVFDSAIQNNTACDIQYIRLDL